jgi:glycosyltransferase involved in cell wall biosynthesis
VGGTLVPPSRTIAVLHDYFGIRGGGERLVLTLCRELGADLAYAYREPESFGPEQFPPVVHDLNLPRIFRRPGLRVVALSMAFARARGWASPYPTRIYSGVAALFAAPPKGLGRNIFYCHTPPRFLFDKKQYFSSGNRLVGGLRRVVEGWFERRYRRAVDRMDLIVTNSETTRARIKRYLGRDSVVVYPPCDTERFVWRGQGDYYLSTARLTGLKRVDVIVDAFRLMPDKRLIVASGGEELEALKRRAKGAPNISFLGWVGETELIDLVGGAIATIYVPQDEDFGMSAVESMAAGKPVIGVAEGGLLETIVDDETGILLKPDFTAHDLAQAISGLTPARALSMRDACEAGASRFSVAAFAATMRGLVGPADGNRA